MKEKGTFRKTLETQTGKTNFIGMLICIGLTYVISYYFADRKWYDFGVMIAAFLSLAMGTNFCKALLLVKDGKDPDTARY